MRFQSILFIALGLALTGATHARADEAGGAFETVRAQTDSFSVDESHPYTLDLKDWRHLKSLSFQAEAIYREASLDIEVNGATVYSGPVPARDPHFLIP